MYWVASWVKQIYNVVYKHVINNVGLRLHPLLFMLYRPLEVIDISKIERFSIECCKTKTKVITPTNHKGHRQSSEPINM